MKSREQEAIDTLSTLSEKEDKALLVIWLGLSEVLARRCPEKLAATFTNTLKANLLDKTNELEEFTIVATAVFANVQRALTVNGMIEEYSKEALLDGRMNLFNRSNNEEYDN